MKIRRLNLGVGIFFALFSIIVATSQNIYGDAWTKLAISIVEAIVATINLTVAIDDEN